MTQINYASEMYVYIPYYNLATNLIQYQPILVPIATDSGTDYTDQMMTLMQYAMLNKANQDWAYLANGELQNFTGLSGENVLASSDDMNPQIWGIGINPTTIPPNIDRWYGSSNFGIYGVACPGGGAYATGETTFINRPGQAVRFVSPGVEACTLTLKTGVIANVTLATQQTYPVLFYSTEFLTPFTPPDSGWMGNPSGY